MPVPGQRRGLEAAHVSLAAAAVVPGVAVEQLAPEAAVRHPDAVVVARDGCEVEGCEQRALLRPSPAQQGDDALLRVVAVDPAETGGLEVGLVERRLGAEQAVEILEPALQALMQGRE